MRLRDYPILLLILALALVGACNSYPSKDPSVKAALKELDQLLDNREEIYRMRESRIAELRRNLSEASNDYSRISIMQAIYNEYLIFDKDSALYYAHLKDTLARKTGIPDLMEKATLDLSNRYLISGMYMEALEAMAAFDSTGPVTPGLVLPFYQIMNSLYHGLTFTITDPLLKGPSHEKDLYYQKKIREYTDATEFNHIRLLAQQYMVENDFTTARDSLEAFLNSGDHPIKDKSVLNYLIGKTYAAERNDDQALAYFARSASCDIANADRASRSLVQAAKLMLKKGEVTKAYSYIDIAYTGAITSDAHVCMKEVIAIMPSIADAYEHLNKRRIWELSFLLILMVLSAGIILFGLVRGQKMRFQIQRAYSKNKQMTEDLKVAVERLKETNDIKDRYLWNYISVFSNHINSLEEYRSMLRNVSKSMDINDVIRTIRNDDFIEGKRKKLYEEFDHAFLGIFPDFIAQLNALLKDDQHIGEGLPAGTLTNELRVFALIRLGVNESADIAHFLKKSPSTIYNYRVKLRNASIYPNEDFEKHLMDIGKL